MPEERSYIDWEPVITPEEVFSDAVGISEVQAVGKQVYWLESRPSEAGRYTLCKRNLEGEIEEVLPKGYSARTRVHEYGGGSYVVNASKLIFTNFSDQRLCQMDLDTGKITFLTPAKNKDGSLGKYAHLVLNQEATKLIFVYEKEFADKENVNCIAMLNLDGTKDQEPTILVEGNDFYADPCLFENKLAWLEWSHPFMPWDSTYLKIGTFDGSNVSSVQSIAGGDTTSICLPKFDQTGKLYFCMDEAKKEENDPLNYWNLYRYDKEVEAITSEQTEFGTPHWVFGQSEYVFDKQGNIITHYSREGKTTLAVVDTTDKKIIDIPTQRTYVTSMSIGSEDRIFFVAADAVSPLALYEHNPKNGHSTKIKEAMTKKIQDKDISFPHHINWTINDAKAYGHLYMPKNSNFKAPQGERPPLYIAVHGGPTSCAKVFLRYSVQYWTSQGFAYLDLNYRGSTGYGRKFRDALKFQWGVVDNDDAAHAVMHLSKQGTIDPKRVVMSGGSAGGYMVQRALTTYPDLYAAGASYYGIGDLLTFDDITHKFESKYDHAYLLGKTPEEDPELYKERSPILFLDNLKAPMILFQGTDDKIVPPECSREVHAALNKKGIMNEYYEYAGEAHGFRKKENNVDSLSKESAFYKKVFSMKGDNNA